MAIQTRCPECRKWITFATNPCNLCGMPVRASKGLVYRVRATDGSFRLDGKGRKVRNRVTALIGRDLAKAQEMDAELAYLRTKGEPFSQSKLSTVTLGDVRDKYLKSADATGKRDFDNRAWFIRKAVAGLGEAMQVTALNAAMVAQYQEARGSQVSPATVNRELAYLTVALKWAARTGLIGENPVDTFKRGKERVRERICKPEEYHAIVNELALHALPVFELRYRLPFRGWEIIQGLTVEDVHLDDDATGRGYIEVPGAFTKSGESRIIPLWWPHLRKLLTGLIGDRETGPLFIYRDKPFKTMRTAFRRACERAGVKDLQERDLRHTAITRLVRRGVPLHELALASDHKGLLIQNRYTNMNREVLLERLTEYYNPRTGVIEPIPETVAPGGTARTGGENVG